MTYEHAFREGQLLLQGAVEQSNRTGLIPVVVLYAPFSVQVGEWHDVGIGIHEMYSNEQVVALLQHMLKQIQLVDNRNFGGPLS